MKEYHIIIIYSEELKRDVKIYISLPKNYNVGNKEYPVLYLNDGQILFNDYDDYNGTSWGIMDEYKKDPNSTELILIGVGSTKARTNELFPFSFEHPNSGNIVGGKAKDYMDFIVTTIIPIINQTYRTLPSPEHTGILGISVGGACALYAATNYTKYFTIFGCVSSAFAPIKIEMVELVENSDFSRVKKMYMDVGTNESDNETRRFEYIESNVEVFRILEEKIKTEKIKCETIKDSQHIEKDWAKRFPSIIKFLFSEWLN